MLALLAWSDPKFYIIQEKDVWMNMKLMTEWQRLEYDTTPIYIRPGVPDWFVPNQMADTALAKL